MADAPVLHPTTLLEMEAGRRALARNQVAVVVPVVEEAVVEEAVVEELPTLKRRGRQPKATTPNEVVVPLDEPVPNDLFGALDAPLP